MFRNIENYASPESFRQPPQHPDAQPFGQKKEVIPHKVITALPPLVARYLDHLALSTAQREWIAQQVAAGMSSQERSSMHQPPAFSSFSLLQRALADLSDGDELNTRLSLIFPIPDSVSRPTRWLRRQAQPPIQRSSMTSRPFLRPFSMALRDWFAGLRRTLEKTARPELA